MGQGSAAVAPVTPAGFRANNTDSAGSLLLCGWQRAAPPPVPLTPTKPPVC